MKSTARTAIIVALGAAIVAGVPGAVTTSVNAAELKLAHFMSPRHPMDRFIMRPWSQQVAKLSADSLKVRIYPGGALGKGPVAQFKRAVDGITDIAFGLQGFTSKLFPRTGMIELSGMAPDAVAATDQLWSAFDLLAPEYRRVEALALWTNDRQLLMTRDKPIRSIADLKDMKMRVPSKAQGETMRALGAVPVFMPINRVYNAMNTGVIDGIMTGGSTIRSFKFSEVAKYFTIGLPMGRSPFFLVMNKRSFKRLSKSHRDLIDKTTGREMSLRAAKFYMTAGIKAIDKVRKSPKHEVITMSGAELRKGTDILMRSRAAQIGKLEKRGVPARQILKAMGVAGG